jgi:hypothetical protein
MLERCDGHACRVCGCTDHRLWGRARIFGVEYQRFRCGGCGEESERPVAEIEAERVAREQARQEIAEEMARWPRTKCPTCGGSDVPVRSTREKIRHHLCGDCGRRFKSIERE